MQVEAGLPTPSSAYARSPDGMEERVDRLEKALCRIERLLAEAQWTQAECDHFLLQRIEALQENTGEDRDGS